MTRLSAVWSTVIHSSLLSNLRSYSRNRRLSVVLIILSLIAIVLLSVRLWRVYRYETPSTSVQIVGSSEEYDVVGASLRFVYVPNNEDLLMLRLDVDSKVGSLDGKTIMLILSRNLQPVTPSLHRYDYELSNRFRFRSDNFDGYKAVYMFKDDDHAVILEEFEGNLFGNSQVGLNFDFYIYSHMDGHGPVDVVIQGLSETNVYSAFPEPEVTQTGLYMYHFDSFDGPYGIGIDLDLNALDVREMQSAQFYLFLLGAGFAIATSALVNILTDFAAYSSE